MIKVKFYYTIILLCSVCFSLQGQGNEIDSLKQLFYGQPISEESLDICLQIALEERQNNGDSADHYFNLAYLSSKDKFKDYKTKILIDYAEYLMSYVSNFSKADSILSLALKDENAQSKDPQKLLDIYKWQTINSGLLGNEKEGKTAIANAEALISTSSFEDKALGIYYSDVAEYYGIIGDFENGTQSLLTAIEYYTKIEDNYGISIAYLNLAIRHINIKQFEKAKNFGSKALELLDKQNDEFLRGHCNVILMATNSELNFPEQAKTFGENALAIWRNLNNTNQIASVLRNLATLNRKANTFELALQQINESIDIFQRLNIPDQLTFCWAEKAMIHAKMNQLKEANLALERFNELDATASPDISDRMSLLEITEQVYALTGNFELAYQQQKALSAIKDSIVTSENLASMEELETKYFTKEKDAEIAFQESQLHQQKLMLWILGLLLLSLIAMAFIFWRNANLRKKVNQQLLELDAAKSTFFTNISHELRTPLTLILAPIKQLLEKTKDPIIKEELTLAHSNSKKLSRLVDEIMDLAKLEGGKMQLKSTPVALEQLLRRIFYSYHSLAQMKDFILSFSYHLPEDLGVMIDVEKVEKVLNNLLSNAFKHSHEGGVITLRVSTSSNLPKITNSKRKTPSLNTSKWIKIEVQDTGKGISIQDQDKIFDRFYQVEQSQNNMQGGTGIGLSYAKEIAKFMGGDLFVKSELGKGSNFAFFIPLEKTKLPHPISHEKESVVEEILPDKASYQYKEKRQSHQILIVEDNPEMSQFLSRVLSDHYECITASDGIQALAKMKRAAFDLIISDVMMPNMDGFELLKTVKSQNGENQIPIILLTARAMEEDKLKALRLGVDDYLTKPFNVEELIARSQNLIQNKSVRDEVLKEKPPESTTENNQNFEQQQLSMAEQIVVNNIDNSKFKVDDLATEMNYSRRQVERIIKKLTGLTPGGFIREIRLQKARTLLENRQYATIAEVRYAVGFDNASHFSKIFQDRFGIRPSMVE